MVHVIDSGWSGPADGALDIEGMIGHVCRVTWDGQWTFRGVLLAETSGCIEGHHLIFLELPSGNGIPETVQYRAILLGEVDTLDVVA